MLSSSRSPLGTRSQPGLRTRGNPSCSEPRPTRNSAQPQPYALLSILICSLWQCVHLVKEKKSHRSGYYPKPLPTFPDLAHNCQTSPSHRPQTRPNKKTQQPHPSTTMHSLSSSLLSFDETLKLRVHILQIALILLAIILSIARVTIRNPPATRANTVAITMVRILPSRIENRSLGTNSYWRTASLTNTKTGPQIPHRHRLPTPHRAPRALPQVG